MSETKTINIPTEQQFSLSKVKLVKDGGLIVNYEVTEVVNEQAYSNKYTVESAKDIHPDLKNLFNSLRSVIGRVFHLISFKSLLDTPGFKATKSQKELGESYSEKVLDNIEARGLSFSGADDNVAVIITGLMTVGNGQKTAINTPRIKFNSETYGFEEDLESIVFEIETEVYEFLFKGKKAQLELFGATGEPNIPEDEHKLITDENNDNEEHDVDTDEEENDDDSGHEDAEDFSDDGDEEIF
jgi:hypothetical protein